MKDHPMAHVAGIKSRRTAEDYEAEARAALAEPAPDAFAEGMADEFDVRIRTGAEMIHRIPHNREKLPKPAKETSERHVLSILYGDFLAEKIMILRASGVSMEDALQQEVFSKTIEQAHDEPKPKLRPSALRRLWNWITGR